MGMPISRLAQSNAVREQPAAADARASPPPSCHPVYNDVGPVKTNFSVHFF